ncbi:hypothetical protein [Bordetella avium]|uniref:hypothetical protein n=1 Tax=Bordetella avium TaxID=521 RepID=UPI000E69C765|nr:hypothetical protein [Bordetella avium]RIQ76102.1 hypothetical protein D0835_17505 [Bordetella avium]RIQ78985.1 hypothetical protein D0835_11280 [Bordetella avium]UOK17392.1 hypothetical protein vBBaMIFTN6_59 [Bordetella phage vB_BaM-IFTN6]
MQLTDHHMTSLGALVINEMRLMYGTKFGQQWQGLTARELKDSWDQKLSGLTEREVRTGLTACLTRDWPPSLPEFLRLCRPWMNPEVAYHEAVVGMASRRRGDMGTWSHPAIYWAAVHVGPHDLLNSSYSVMKTRWERAFGDELAKGQWHGIPEVLEVLPAPGQTQATREEAAAALKAMGADKVLEPKRSRDPRNWAKKILEEQERKGGRRYAFATLTMAKRALGLELNPGEA